MRHQVVDARGTRIHCVEEGSGPLVLLVHGFPESWYSWRHQLPAIAAAGFRAVAIDVRGYGRSSAPLEVDAYGMLQHVNDNIGVVEALAGRGSTAIVIGHDWGAPIAAHSALLRPDIFTAVAMLSVPTALLATGGPPRPSPRWPGWRAPTRSSTSATSRSRAGPSGKPSSTCDRGCSASTSRRQATGLGRPAGEASPPWLVAPCCGTAFPPLARFPAGCPR